jgi:hypothetical protein
MRETKGSGFQIFVYVPFNQDCAVGNLISPRHATQKGMSADPFSFRNSPPHQDQQSKGFWCRSMACRAPNLDNPAAIASDKKSQEPDRRVTNTTVRSPGYRKCNIAVCRPMRCKPLSLNWFAVAWKKRNNPAHVPPGELRKVERPDEYGKVKFMGRPRKLCQANDDPVGACPASVARLGAR